MKTIKLAGKSREITKKSELNAMRRNGEVPCVLYGRGVDNVHFTLSARDLLKITNTPNSYIIDLEIDGKDYFAVYHRAQFHPLTDEPLHIDFLAISDDRPVVIDVPIIVTGNSEGVRQGGKLILSSRKVKVSALRDKLPDNITVDITPLKIGKSFFAGDIEIEDVQIITPASTIICSVKMTRAAIGAAAAAAAAAGKK